MLAELFLYLISQLVFDGLIELVAQVAFGKSRRRDASANVILLVAFGLGTGGFSMWLWPAHFLPDSRLLRLAALVAIPVAVGSGMHALGRGLQRRGRSPTIIATFSGGAILSFCVTFVRHLSH